jgi:cytochrome c2
MKNRSCRASLVIATLLVLAILSVGQSKKLLASAQKPTGKSQGSGGANKGEHLFQVHCGRCHQPPEQLSPRIAGTVVRHMRERAILSQEDERVLLQYLAR